MDTSTIVTIIIRNAAGEFYAHQRGVHKKVFPGLYGLGAGGHIQVGENPLQAAIRELKEETGLEDTPLLLFSFLYSDDSISHTIHVHYIETEHLIQVDHTEWQWAGFLTQKEVERLLEEEKLCPDTALMYRRYLTIS